MQCSGKQHVMKNTKVVIVKYKFKFEFFIQQFKRELSDEIDKIRPTLDNQMDDLEDIISSSSFDVCTNKAVYDIYLQELQSSTKDKVNQCLQNEAKVKVDKKIMEVTKTVDDASEKFDSTIQDDIGIVDERVNDVNFTWKIFEIKVCI